MMTVNSTNIKNHFGEYLDRSRESPIQITKNGRPSAVLLSWKEFEMMELLLENNLYRKPGKGKSRPHSHEESLQDIMSQYPSKKEIKLFLDKLRGSAHTSLTTDEIMKLTRGDD